MQSRRTYCRRVVLVMYMAARPECTIYLTRDCAWFIIHHVAAVHPRSSTSERPPMNAMQKVAWTELVVSISAVAVVCVLFPFIGSRATSAFALLGLVALGRSLLTPPRRPGRGRRTRPPDREKGNQYCRKYHLVGSRHRVGRRQSLVKPLRRPRGFVRSAELADLDPVRRLLWPQGPGRRRPLPEARACRVRRSRR